VVANLASLLLVFGCVFSGYGVVGQVAFYSGLIYFLYNIFLQINRRSDVLVFLSVLIFSIYSGSGVGGDAGDLKYFIRYQLVTAVILFLLVFMRSKSNFNTMVIPALGVVQSIVLVSVAVYLSIFGSYDLWQDIRHFVRLNDIGDIWTTDGFYYRVQLRGNHFVFIAWLFHFILGDMRTLKDKLIFMILTLGVFFAGNASYLLCSVALILFYFLKNFRFRYLFLIVFCFVVLVGSGVFDSFANVLSRKFGGIDSSGGARLEQVTTFFNAIYEEGFYLHGAGAGAPYPTGKYGDSGSRTLSHYTELQSLFYMYKFGLFFSFLFIMLVLWPLFCYRDLNRKVFYLFYIVGSILNPYIYDANHIVVLLTLMSVSHENTRRSKYLK